MNRYVSIFLIWLLLCLQGATAVHAADYGAGEHEHHGELCEFYLYAQQVKASDIPSPITLSLPAVFADNVAPFSISYLPQARYLHAASRAPPHFS